MWLLLNFAEQWRTDEMRSSGWWPRILQKQISDALRLEIAPPGKVSRDRVVWWLIDHALCQHRNWRPRRAWHRRRTDPPAPSRNQVRRRNYSVLFRLHVKPQCLSCWERLAATRARVEARALRSLCMSCCSSAADRSAEG
jgi:hypothetical protein